MQASGVANCLDVPVRRVGDVLPGGKRTVEDAEHCPRRACIAEFGRGGAMMIPAVKG